MVAQPSLRDVTGEKAWAGAGGTDRPGPARPLSLWARKVSLVAQRHVPMQPEATRTVVRGNGGTHAWNRRHGYPMG
ncbi:hypothetical protein HZZ02_23105 [Streptococcus danieliae]|nr:hypothetical protein [Streptococcus danieliae]